MPTYEYVCTSCGYRFEQFQNMTDKAVQKCPKCGESVKKLIGTGMGVIFKGSGFYSTDYKNNNKSGRTCCGRTERCSKPPCSDDRSCRR